MNGFVIVLYGSHARGQADGVSDVDVLSVGDVPPSALEDAGILVNGRTQSKISLSSYHWDEFRRMSEAGAPFLSHLRQDGKIIDGDDVGVSWYEALLANLPPYRHSKRDVASFDAALDDVALAIQLRDSSAEFEAASIATVVRHASILGCYLLDTPRFGRHEPTVHFCRARKLPMEIAMEFSSLYQHRIALARGYAWPDSTDYTYVARWLGRGRQLVQEVKSVAS